MFYTVKEICHIFPVTLHFVAVGGIFTIKYAQTLVGDINLRVKDAVTSFQSNTFQFVTVNSSALYCKRH